MSDIDCDQSISDIDVKSCNGTYFHFGAGLSWVILRTPKRVRANLDFTYLRQASASDLVSNEPMLMKDCVCPIRGSPIRGVESTSPKAPEPFDLGRNILYW